MFKVETRRLTRVVAEGAYRVAGEWTRDKDGKEVHIKVPRENHKFSADIETKNDGTVTGLVYSGLDAHNLTDFDPRELNEFFFQVAAECVHFDRQSPSAVKDIDE